MKKYPLFIILFAIYPSLALLTWNFREVDSSGILRPLLFSLLVTLLVCSIIYLLIRNISKAILISTVFLILFFSYGHIALMVEGSTLPAVAGEGNWLANVLVSVLMLVVLIVACRMLLKTTRDLSPLYQVLNVMSMFLVVSSGFVLVNNSLARAAGSQNQQKASSAPVFGPDVYYIILDAYGRQDSLKSLGYDNEAFLQELEEIGFYIPSCSRSNYPQTVMSMASSLNMGYLWDAIPNQGPNDRNSEPVYAGIRNSRVRQEFEERGYKIILFDSGADWLKWRNVDQLIALPTKPLFTAQLHPFEYIFLDTTALHPLMTRDFFLQQKYVYNYDLIHFILDELPQIARSESPKFVYAHMLIPHRPNIFLPDGSMNLDTNYYKKGVGEGINRQYDIEGYINNTKFINSRLPGVVREIMANSQTPPIIIIQGDHGYQLPDIRFDILNAYYFPDQDYAALYPTISPVNTFRVVLNTFFDEEFPLLKDQSINVGINRPYGKKIMKPSTCP